MNNQIRGRARGKETETSEYYTIQNNSDRFSIFRLCSFTNADGTGNMLQKLDQHTKRSFCGGGGCGPDDV